MKMISVLFSGKGGPSALALLLCLLPLATNAAQSGDFTYFLTNDTITITGYTGPGGMVDIPPALDSWLVTAIGERAFAGNSNLTGFKIEEALATIGDSAFADCAKLTSVIIRQSITNIGSRAFSGCSRLTNISLPGNITHFGDEAFRSCSNLTRVCFQGDAPTIGSGLFNGSNPTIYYRLGTTGWSPTFGDCPTVPLDLPFSFEINNTTITITGCPGSNSVVTIPNKILELPVTAIGDSAFDSCANLASITIPDGISAIPGRAFYGCSSLTNVSIPASVTSIGGYAFQSCRRLRSLTIPAGVPAIAQRTFAFSGLATINLPDSVTRIEEGAFRWCSSLTNVTTGRSVTTIGNEAFFSCYNLTEVSILESVTTIGFNAFAACGNLTRVTIGSSVTNIGGQAFFGSLSTIYFKGNAPSLEYWIFGGAGVVHYLPGTMGWGPTFSGRPTTPWLLPNPTILNSRPSFGVQSNRFGFRISWATNISVVVDATTNLTAPTWSPLSTNALIDGWTDFSDPQWTNHPARFYRVRSL